MGRASTGIMTGAALAQSVSQVCRLAHRPIALLSSRRWPALSAFRCSRREGQLWVISSGTGSSAAGQLTLNKRTPAHEPNGGLRGSEVKDTVEKLGRRRRLSTPGRADGREATASLGAGYGCQLIRRSVSCRLMLMICKYSPWATGRYWRTIADKPGQLLQVLDSGGKQEFVRGAGDPV